MAAPEERGQRQAPRSLPAATEAAAPMPMPSAEVRAGNGGNPGSTTFIRRLGSPETPWNVQEGDEDERPEPRSRGTDQE